MYILPINSTTSGECKCNICGNVWATRADVILRGCGCRKCFNKRNSENRLFSIEEIERKIYEINKNLEIDRDTYIDTKHKAKIKCLKCGHIWFPKINDILTGHGCPVCALEKSKYSQNKAINILKNIYKDDFKYDKAVYKGCHNKITLICSQCNKEVTTSFNRFITKNVHCTCSSEYKKSHLEQDISRFINVKNETFEEQKHFEWLKNGSGQLTLDFYLPKYKIAIECQGEQHFIPKSFGCCDSESANENFVKQQERDKRKKDLCEEHGVKLIYFLQKKHRKYITEDDEKYFTNKESLFEYLKQ